MHSSCSVQLSPYDNRLPSVVVVLVLGDTVLELNDVLEFVENDIPLVIFKLDEVVMVPMVE